MKEKKIIIIGGGYGGLALGALMARHDFKVHLYEAHTYLGGCASFFKRGKFTFDSGATTLSGLNENRTLEKLCRQCGITFNSLHLKTPMAIVLNNQKRIMRHQNHETFLKELKKHWPKIDHQIHWDRWRQREHELWDILATSQYFPPKNLKDLKELVRPKVLKSAPLGVHALRPFHHYLSSAMKESPDYMDFLNEQLLISTQSHADKVPALLAAMGLLYPEDMHYSFGGMSALAYKLAQVIKDHGGEVHLRHKVGTFTKTGDEFHVEGLAPAKKTFSDKAPLLVSNLTMWDTVKLQNPKTSQSKLPPKRGAWGAITGYWAVKTEKPLDPLYYQVHFEGHPLLKKGSLFFSFSHPEDKERAPEGWQTVTVSTHTETELWEKAYCEGTYEEMKKNVLSFFLEKFQETLKDFGILEIKRPELGTPHTFEHFTGRHRGLVGGLPHNQKNNILTYPAQETGIENFYRVGDTTFPGQGVVGVSTGAFILAGKLLGKNLLT